MAKTRRNPLNISFSVPEPLRGQLERFARDVQTELNENANDDVRPLRASDEPLGVGGVYRLDSGSSPVERALPRLGSEDNGKAITIIRTDVGTASFYAVSPATISGKSLDYLPPRKGAYTVFWDGANWYWQTAPGLPYLKEWGASELKGGFGEASLGVSGSATLLDDPLRSGVKVRGFGKTSHDSITQEFFVPTGTQGNLKVRTYFRAGSAPTGAGVVSRRLHVREFVHGSGVPSGFTVYTLPCVTLADANWQYKEDLVPLSKLGIKGGRVQVVFSRPSPFPYVSPDLNTMLLLESLMLEIDT